MEGETGRRVQRDRQCILVSERRKVGGNCKLKGKRGKTEIKKETNKEKGDERKIEKKRKNKKKKRKKKKMNNNNNKYNKKDGEGSYRPIDRQTFKYRELETALRSEM